LRENRLAIALYPGSFDPVHIGHLDIIDRACRMFRRVVVGVAKNVEKTPMFSVADRVAMLRAAAARADIEVMSFEGLTVDFAHRLGARIIVKGLRAMMDFEYELKMAAMNKRLRPEIETVFMMTSPEFAYLSSTLIREVVGFGGSVSGLIPPAVERRLTQRVSRSQRKR
jgi:pantetheine-phosphate adenylyltransferase